ncbi:MAG TPA: hypothetical protein VE197_06435 [Mycobacterium sp.]|nr:hypothetical protein [Mycobacterium sp.]
MHMSSMWLWPLRNWLLLRKLSLAGDGDKELAGNAPGLDDEVFLNIPAVRIEEASQVYGPASANESRGDSPNPAPATRYQSCQSRLSIRKAGQTGQAAGDENTVGLIDERCGVVVSEKIKDVGSDEPVGRAVSGGQRQRAVGVNDPGPIGEDGEASAGELDHPRADIHTKVGARGRKVIAEQALGQAAGPGAQLEDRRGGRETAGGDEPIKRRSFKCALGVLEPADSVINPRRDVRRKPAAITIHRLAAH